MSEKFSLKDHLFNKTSVTRLAGWFVSADPIFPETDFVQSVLKQFPDLALKERIHCIAVELKKVLPADFLEATDIIVAALPPILDPENTDDDFGDFVIAPLAEYVAMHGCTAAYLSRSLEVLREITMRFSVEFAIRRFLNVFPEETYQFMVECAEHEHYHVRRLVSEGLRPRLPWAENIDISYHKTLPVLDVLFSDDTRYVTRSVANHLNDISKIDGDVVLATLASWQASHRQKTSEMHFITQHSLRTLVKRGNKKALAMLGYEKPPQVEVSIKKYTKKVPLGTHLDFDIEVTPHRDQKLMISYYIYFLNAKNNYTSKIFQIKKCSVKQGEVLQITKKHLLRNMTTRTLYTGKHALQILVNGLPVTEKVFFTLTKE
jgi:3-methyladenine DNA glycosylase AlkC